MVSKLSKDEQVALAGVIKWVVSADHEDSIEGIEDFFKENGWDDFNSIYDEMDQKFSEIDDLKIFLKGITNKESRDIIVQIAQDIAISDALITNEEKKIIKFLKDIWN